ncbi:MAG: hypothetical protein V2I27_04110 [Erythrobacter sp.]|jgi:tetratricopeptide (TPR) repeat protein|nr:hypothetical protein [Erythrobacter sp.]
MILLDALLPLALMQVGLNPNAPDTLAIPEELLNRPPRRDGQTSEIANPTSAWLAQCLELIETDPARAHAQAQIRVTETLGPERVIAQHCLGLAATQLGLWSDAQSAFIAAREGTPEVETRARARFSAMAGNAALAGGDPARALELLGLARSEAAAAASADLEAVAAIDAARALVALDRPDEALAQLEDATRLVPEASESWLLKATLLRRMDRLGEAQTAIETAAGLAPLDLAIGLEAGVIAVFSGREEAARASWQSVIDTQPDSLAAQTAREYMAQLSPDPAAGES